jgi:hypothetical protein
MNNFTLKEIGHGGKVDVRVGRHIEALTGVEIMRPHVIEKIAMAPHRPYRFLGGGGKLESRQIEFDAVQ